LLVHLQHPLCQESEEVVDYVRSLLFRDEIARSILGQAVLDE
jgi:hypothetical protein